MPQPISYLLNWGAPWQTNVGTALSTATTATISPQAAGPKDFPVPSGPGSPLFVGQTFRLTANGILTTTATSTTATIFAAAGSTVTAPGILTAPGITTGATAITGIPWFWESWHTVLAIASTGNTFNSWGKLTMGNSGAGLIANPVALTATPGMTLPAPPSGGQIASAVDTTVAMPIMLRGTLAAANATIQCQNFLVEALAA